MKISDAASYPRPALALVLFGVIAIAAIPYLLYLSAIREELQNLGNDTRSLASLIDDFAAPELLSHSQERNFIGTPAGKLISGHFTSRETATRKLILVRETAGEPQLLRAKANHGFAVDHGFDAELSSSGHTAKAWPDGSGEFINHQGVNVLAAYVRIPELGLAVFQRIEKGEIKARFIRRGVWISAISLLSMGLFITAHRKILAHKLSEAAAANNQRLLTTFETAPVLMVMLSPDGLIQDVNLAFSNLTGRKAEEVRGKIWVAEFIPPADRENIRILIQKAASGIQTSGYLNPILTPSGERMIEWYDNVWYDSHGQATSILAVGVDATERLQALNAFCTSEERYRQLVQSALYCIHEISPAGQVVSINRAGFVMLGCNDAAEVEGKQYLDWVSAEDQPRVSKLFKAAIGGNPSSYEFTSINNRRFDSNFIPLRSGGIMGITRDVTDQRAMAQREEERMHQLRQLSQLSLMLAGDSNSIFIRIVQMIAELFKFPVVCHAEISDGKLHFKTMFIRGEVRLDAGSCRLEVAPCATVEQMKDIQIHERVTESFPEANFLRDYNAHTYCGFPAVDSAQNVLAVVFVLDDKPRDISPETRDILRVIGQRIAVEVERRNQGLAHEQVEKALKESETRLQTAQSIAAIGNWELDHSCGSLWWSDQIYSIFEVTAVNFRPNYEEFLNAVHPDDCAQVKQAFTRSIDDRVPYQITHRLLMPDGRVKFVEERCETDFADDGRPLLSRGTVQDVSVRIRIEQKLRELLAEKEVLMREIHHRVKNNLQILSSLLHFQIKKAGSALDQAAFQDMQNRVRSMALIHERLYRTSNLSRVDFRGYLSSLVNDLSQSYGQRAKVQLRVSADAIDIPIEQAMPLGMLITELVMNALKHAFPHDRTGQVLIHAHHANHHLIVQVADDGVGLPSAVDIAAGKSFGWTLINALASQINAKVECARENGTEVTIQLQIPAAVPFAS